MAEFTAPNIQIVAAGQNVPLISTSACGKPCIVHRDGSGLVTLRGLTQQCKAKFRVSLCDTRQDAGRGTGRRR